MEKDHKNTFSKRCSSRIYSLNLKSYNSNLLKYILEFLNVKDLLKTCHVSKQFSMSCLSLAIISKLFQCLKDKKITLTFVLENNAGILNTILEDDAIPFMKGNRDAFADVFIYFLLKRHLQMKDVQRCLKIGNKIGENGIKALARVLPQFTINSLDLSMCKIGNEGLRNLLHTIKTFPSLKRIKLEDNQLTVEGMKEISMNLPTQIEILDISSNHCEEGGCEFISAYMIKNSQLKELYIGSNRIKSKGVANLIKSWNEDNFLQVLDLQSNEINDEGCGNISDMLSHSNVIMSLDLSRNKITSIGCTSLLNGLLTSNSIADLHLQVNQITGDCGKCLSNFLRQTSSLKKLNLSSNSLSEMGCLDLSDGLRVNSTLTHLNLSSNNLNDIGAKYILTSLTENVECLVEHLDISSNNLTDDISEYLGKLIMNSNIIKSINVSSGELSHITALNISESITCNISLEKLDISDNQLEDQGVEILCNAIDKNLNRTKLLELNLSMNSISNACLSCIVPLIMKNRISKLFLRGNLFAKDQDKDNKIKDFGNALAITDCLVSLDISYNELGDEGVREIIEGIMNSHVVKWINLRKTGELGKNTIKYIQHVMKSKPEVLIITK